MCGYLDYVLLLSVVWFTISLAGLYYACIVREALRLVYYIIFIVMTLKHFSWSLV